MQAFRKCRLEDMDDTLRKQAAVICSRALAMLDRYMELHAELLPDRGCEGTLVSVYHTPVAVLKRLLFEYGGVGEPLPVRDEEIDEPPTPLYGAG
jgi:hypothetical protein